MAPKGGSVRLISRQAVWKLLRRHAWEESVATQVDREWFRLFCTDQEQALELAVSEAVRLHKTQRRIGHTSRVVKGPPRRARKAAKQPGLAL